MSLWRLLKCWLSLCYGNIRACKAGFVQFIDGFLWLIKSEVLVWSFKNYLRCWAVNLPKWLRVYRLFNFFSLLCEWLLVAHLFLRLILGNLKNRVYLLRLENFGGRHCLSLCLLNIFVFLCDSLHNFLKVPRVHFFWSLIILESLMVLR